MEQNGFIYNTKIDSKHPLNQVLRFFFEKVIFLENFLDCNISKVYDDFNFENRF